MNDTQSLESIKSGSINEFDLIPIDQVLVPLTLMAVRKTRRRRRRGLSFSKRMSGVSTRGGAIVPERRELHMPHIAITRGEVINAGERKKKRRFLCTIPCLLKLESCYY